MKVDIGGEARLVPLIEEAFQRETSTHLRSLIRASNVSPNFNT